MKVIWGMLRKPDGSASIGRVCALFTFILWVFVSLFLVLTNRTWAHYDTLTIAAIGFLLVQLCNKTVDSKLISVKVGDDK